MRSRMEAPATTSRPLRVTHPLTTIIGVVAVVMFTTLLISLFLLDMTEAWMYVACIVFVALGMLVILIYGETIMDTQTITHINRLGRFQIRWSDVLEVETDGKNSIVFKGDNAQLVIPWQDFWAGKDKQEMAALMDRQMRQRNLEMKQNWFAAYKLSRHTKVPRT